MKVRIITIFPVFFESCLGEGLLGKAAERGLVEIEAENLRDYATDRHRTVDGTPYGGGPGLVMKVDIWAKAIEAARRELGGCRVVMLSPGGERLSDDTAKRLAREEAIVFCCGRYEGVDERVAEHLVDEQLSIGDYVLTGGEAAALVAVDAIARKLPGVVGRSESVDTDSFTAGLKFPQYTRPAEFRDWPVPEVLRSGDHGAIERWREQAARERTATWRPDLGARAIAASTTLVLADPKREQIDFLTSLKKAYGLGAIGLAVTDTEQRQRLRHEYPELKVWGGLDKAARRWADHWWIHVAQSPGPGQVSSEAIRRQATGEKRALTISFGGPSPAGVMVAAPVLPEGVEPIITLSIWLDRLLGHAEKRP